MPSDVRPPDGGPGTLGELGEFGLIARVAARLGAPPPPVGPGDDAAVVAAPDGALLATTDLLVEGVHFRTDWSTGHDVGCKAAAQNLADVTAMGGRPAALLVGLVAPAATPVAWLDGLADGLRDEAARGGCPVVGGDTVAGPVLMVSVTALGHPGPRPVLRSGARPGDAVVLLGSLGTSAAGLALLAGGVPAGLDAGIAARLLAAHRRPRPDYAAGPLLAAAGATALCDVSDGLVGDLGHLARAGGVAVVLDGMAALADAPWLADVAAAAHALGGGAAAAAQLVAAWVLAGGEEHSLVGAVPPAALPVVVAAGGRVLGRVAAATSSPGAPGVTVGPTALWSAADAAAAVRRPGWDHFA
ncbi:MAG TPA: thiamine-phosphate kinase [Frankiaceae bacterium]